MELQARIFDGVHLSGTNARLKQEVTLLGRENYYYSPWDVPRNMVEEYLQGMLKRLPLGGCSAIEWWVHISKDTEVFTGFHFDRDECSDGVVHPDAIGCISLTYDNIGFVISNQKYGDPTPKDLLYVMGDEARVTVFPGDYSWSELAGSGEKICIFFNIWRKFIPKCLSRCPVVTDYELPLWTEKYRERKPIMYEGEVVKTTHLVGDTSDVWIMKAPEFMDYGGIYYVPDDTVSTTS